MRSPRAASRSTATPARFPSRRWRPIRCSPQVRGSAMRRGSHRRDRWRSSVPERAGRERRREGRGTSPCRTPADGAPASCSRATPAGRGSRVRAYRRCRRSIARSRSAGSSATPSGRRARVSTSAAMRPEDTAASLPNSTCAADFTSPAGSRLQHRPRSPG